MTTEIRALLSAFGVWVLMATCGAAQTAEVELMTDGEMLQPSTTLEVRFARQMVPGDVVGVPGVPSPLVYRIPYRPAGADPGWLVVSKGDDLHALRMGSSAEELPMAAFRLPIWYRGWGETSEEAPPLRSLVFTDRPLYRPGETVHIKGIVRRACAAGLAAEQNRDGVLVITFPQGKGSTDVAVRTDDRGAFDAEYQLDSSTVGEHSVRIKFAGPEGEWWGRGFVSAFQVADYQPNAFEVSVSAPDAEVKAKVSANYFFGAPLHKSEVRWTLQYSPLRFSPQGFEQFAFGEAEEPEQRALTVRGEGTLDRELSIKPRLPEPEAGPSRGLLTVEVTDLNQQTVSESRRFDRDAAAFYVGIARPDQSVLAQGAEIVARAVAVRPHGEPLTEPVAVKAELVRVRYETVRVQGAGKAVSFRSETVKEVEATAEGQTFPPTRRDANWEAAPGETARFKPVHPGRYQLRVTARDNAGRETVAACDFYVSGDEAIV